jgi:hypothetical protein
MCTEVACELSCEFQCWAASMDVTQMSPHSQRVDDGPKSS